MNETRGKYVYKVKALKSARYKGQMFERGDWRNVYTFDLTLVFDWVDEYLEDFVDLLEIVYRDKKTGVFYRLGIADKVISAAKKTVYLLVYPIEPTELRFAGLCRDRRDFYLILFDSWSGFYHNETGDPAGRLRGKIILNELLQLSERNGAPPLSIFEGGGTSERAPKNAANGQGIPRLLALLSFIRYQNRYLRNFSTPIEAVLNRFRQPFVSTRFIFGCLSPRFRRLAYLQLQKAIQPAAAVLESDGDGYWLYATPVFLQGGFLRERDNKLLAAIFKETMAEIFVDDGVFRYVIDGEPEISAQGNYLGRFPVKSRLKLLGPSLLEPEPGDIAIGSGDYLNLYWWDFGLLRMVTPDNIDQLTQRNRDKRRTSKYGKKFPHIDRGRKFEKEDNE